MKSPSGHITRSLLVSGLLGLLFFAGCIRTIYTPDAFEKVRPGLTQSQVRVLLGWPDGDWLGPQGQTWTYADFSNGEMARIVFDEEGKVVSKYKSSDTPSPELFAPPASQPAASR